MGDAKQLRLASRSERRSAGRLLTRAVNCYRIIAYPETYLPRELGQLVSPTSVIPNLYCSRTQLIHPGRKSPEAATFPTWANLPFLRKTSSPWPPRHSAFRLS